MVNWLPEVGAASIPVAAGSPWENGSIESFHSRLRDEFLERVEFEDVADGRAKASWYRREYNAVRPHSSVGYATPNEFSAAGDQREVDPHNHVRGCSRLSILAKASHSKWTKKRGAAQLYEGLRDDCARIQSVAPVLDACIQSNISGGHEDSSRPQWSVETIHEILRGLEFAEQTLEDSHLGNCATIVGKKPG